MKTLTFPAIFIFLVVLGCSNQNRTSGTSSAEPTTSNVAAAPKTYKSDLIGQSLRIKDEGTTNETIKKNIAEIDKTITYELLKKNSDKYLGKAWGFKGKILETAEKDGSTVARIGLGPYGSNAVYVIGPIETPFVENDQVYVVGYVASPYSYTSQANWNITIPALAVRTMMKPADVKKYK